MIIGRVNGAALGISVCSTQSTLNPPAAIA